VYLDNDIASWWSRLGFAREQAEEYAHAVEAYERALELNPNLAEARRGLERVQVELAG
jgi:cytochrome c-type biogenesis protein CcmH/NrfG